jgi:hypothetical protein
MSIWKSPIFYFGIFLVMGVLAALAAPFIVNWNSYRDNLEFYGRALTGRDVAINGDISAQLFPWPRLVVGDVNLGNPKGISGPPMMVAKTITLQLNLGGLLSGDIQVETITVDQPVITLSRLSANSFNWDFEPHQSVSELKFLSHVKLDQIGIKNGTLRLQERVHGVETAFTDVNVLLSATDFVGPWRVRGTGKQGATPFSLSFNSNAFNAGEPFKFGLKLEPLDGSLLALALEGEVQNANLKGKLRLEPVVTADGRQSLEGSFKPLKLQSDIAASFDQINLEKIQITPADSKDSGTLIEGSASASFSKNVKAVVKLTSPRLDLDALAGSQSLRVWRAGGMMALLNGFIKEFPETLDLSASLDVATVSAAGQNLDNLSLRAAAAQSAIRISELSANLPGRSRMKFNGIVFPSEVAAELGGSLAFESNDTREFTRWLWPEAKTEIAELWTGVRGRVKAQTDVTWSGRRFGFQNLKYELDGEAGDGEVAVQLGKLSAIDLTLNSKVLDLDAYMAGGIARLLQGSNILGILQGDDGFEKRLKLNAGKLRVNGVEALDVGLNFDSSLSGFEIKKLDIGSVEGARLHAEGLVLQGPDGPSGDLKAELTAVNPRGFLRLIGATEKKGDSAWTAVLGATQLKGSFSVKPGTKEPLLSYNVSGQSGPLQIGISGDVKDIAKGNDATFGVSGEITSPNGSEIMRLFEFKLGDSTKPGKLLITAAGTASAGYKAVVSADVLGTKFGYDGLAGGTFALPQLEGKLTLSADDTTELATLLGLPLVVAAGEPTSLTADVKPVDGAIHLENLAGRFASRLITGRVEIDPAGKLNGDLAIDQLDLREVLSAGFMPWQGKVSGVDEAFSNAVVDRSGEVWLRPGILKTGFGPDISMAVLGVSFNPEARQVTLSARDKDAESLKLNISVKPQNGVYAASGTLHIPVELSRVLKLQDGTSLAEGNVIFDGAFEGEGRSPLAVMTALKGNITYVYRDAKLTRVSPKNLFSALGNVKNAEDLQSAFESLLVPPGMVLSAEQLNVSVQEGALTFVPLKMGQADADIQISPRFDLGTGDFEARIDIAAKPERDLPSLGVTYSGLPGALRQRTDTAAVAAKLGYAFVSRDLAELEKIQKEQAQLAAEELAQQKTDEEKFAAYLAQRSELRLRLREQKVFAAQRAIDAERRKANLAKAIKEGSVINAQEVQKFSRQLEPEL